MPTVVTLNGSSYNIPLTGEAAWGSQVTAYLVALSTGVLTKAGGSFTLTADADFGATYGLRGVKFASRNTPATTGIFRLGNAEYVSWRNAANSADLGLRVNASNVLEFNGAPLVNLALGAGNTALVMNAGATAYSWAELVNANIAAAAAIARTKLASGTANHVVINDASGVLSSEARLTGERGGSGVSNLGTFTWGANNITFTTSGVTTLTLPASGTLATLAGSETLTNKTIDASSNTISNISNGNVAAAAGIARTKLASGTSSHVLINDGSGVMSSEAQLAGTRGGSGVSNAGTFTWGANNITLTTSGVTALTLPASGTLATLAGSETLTNKTIDASSNTISNISNGNVAAAAGIARTKLGSGTASHVLINDGSGVMSSEAQLAGTRGGSGVSNAGTFTWGANNITFTTSGATSLNLPTSGTLFANPMTGGGQLMYGTAPNGDPALVAAGSSGQLLMSAGTGAPTWADTITGAKTWSALGTFSSGIQLGAGSTLANYVEGTWTLTEASKTNLTGTATVSEAKYTRIGRLVFFQFKITGLSITASGSMTQWAGNLPINKSNANDIVTGAGSCSANGGGFANAPSFSNVNLAVGTFWFDFTSSGTGAVTIAMQGCYTL
jgi:hypothetical protein